MDEIMGLAMVGSQRRTPALKAPLFAGLGGPPEAQLLGAAALASLSTLAGLKLGAGAAMPPDPPDATRPRAPSRALRRIVDDAQFEPLLGEWLGLARITARSAPEETLPELLDAGRRNRSLRPLLATVCGSRGAWLARHNAAWSYLLGESEEEEVWETGGTTVRIDWLARLRGRDPDRARALLLSSWCQESAADRQKCLATWRTGLSLQDEDFLESALDDRSKEVRRQAAHLLAALPTSRLSQRMRARVAGWVEEKQTTAWLGLRQNWTLQVNPPEQCTPEMARDGIEPKPPAGMGEKAWWLAQGMGLAPLDMWQSPPRELLKAAAQTDWATALQSGWQDAALGQRAPTWAAALLDTGRPEAELFALLPQAEQEKLLLEKLPGGGEAARQWLLLHRPFSLRLAQAVLATLRALAAGPYDWQWGKSFDELALTFPVECAAQIEVGWPENAADWGRWRNPVDRFITLMKFRLAMNEEMRP